MCPSPRQEVLTGLSLSISKKQHFTLWHSPLESANEGDLLLQAAWRERRGVWWRH